MITELLTITESLFLVINQCLTLFCQTAFQFKSSVLRIKCIFEYIFA